MKIYHFL
jgi:hypothetical protein